MVNSLPKLFFVRARARAQRRKREEKRREEKTQKQTTRAMADADENAKNISHQHRLAVKAAKTNKGKRAIEKTAPKRKEVAAKTLLLLHGALTSDVLKSLINDLSQMKYGENHRMNRKNPGIRPFEGGGEVSLEFFAEKSHSACFAFANHQKKKRPNAITFGRFYNHKIYDCVEMMINGESFMSINNFGSVASSTTIGSKPCMMFLGDKFETDAHLKQLKNVFTDIFRGRVVTRINLKGIDRAIVVTALEDGKTILFRQFAIKYKKSGTRLPKVHLEEMGPRFDAIIGRVKLHPPDVEREAMRVDKTLLKEEKSNALSQGVSDKIGKIYVHKQTEGLDEINRRKSLKGGLKKKEK